MALPHGSRRTDVNPRKSSLAGEISAEALQVRAEMVRDRCRKSASVPGPGLDLIPEAHGGFASGYGCIGISGALPLQNGCSQCELTAFHR